MIRRNIALFIFLLGLSTLILLSQNFWTQGAHVSEFFDWMSYESVSGWVWVSWQDSFFSFLSPLIYLPAIAGGIGILGAIALLGSIKASKIISYLAALFAIFAFALFLLFHALFGLAIGAATLIPNMPGAYLCLVPGLLLLICAYLLKSSKEGEGHVMENKQYYAIGGEAQKPTQPYIKAPMIKCPNCGALIQGDQLFCEQCGHYL